MIASITEIREWMTPLAWLLAGGLLSLGLLLPLVFRRSTARLWFTASVFVFWALLAFLSYMPTPSCMTGDGYAVTQAIGAMGALYTLPFTLGVILSCGSSFLIKKIFGCILTNRRSPPQ